MSIRLLRALVAVATSVTLCSSWASGNLLVNGSFEDDVLVDGEWTVRAGLAGWQADASSGVELRRQVAGSAHDGRQYIELDTHFGAFPPVHFDRSSNSAIWQDVDTVAGATYTLSYWYAPRAGIDAGSNTIETWWNGTRLATNTGSGIGLADHAWALYSFAVVGTGRDRLLFAAGGTEDTLGGSLDAVSLEFKAMPVVTARALAFEPPPAVTPVPEPGTWALMLAGLAAVGVARRGSVSSPRCAPRAA